MEKPIPPVKPHPKDFRDSEPSSPKKPSPFVIAFQQYQKDMAKYEADLNTWEQTKFIDDIKRSNIKLCLKKYKITKI